jgi:ABC-2 type transport system ATP-binding protein
MNADSPAVRARGLAHAYPDFFGRRRATTLAGIDLEVHAGAVVGLAGPNGSGKSTLLRVLCGIEPYSAGELTVLGGAPLDREVRARVGYLPEDSPFPPELTAREALELAGALQGLTRAECKRESARLLELVGLAARAKSRLGKFSRGMLRRFGLAQAWIARPALVLLDEPTAGLDAQGFEVLEALLADAYERRATVVFASHLVSDLEDSCDELVVLVGGRVVERGAPRDVLGPGALLELYRRHGAVHAPAASARAPEPRP